MWGTFNDRVRPPGRSFVDNAGGNGKLSENLKAAPPSCSKSDQDNLMISSMSKMYHMAVVSLIWTFAILCNFLSSASFSISKLISMFFVFNTRYDLPKSRVWFEQTALQ
jgi:hypothetical protein